MEASEALEKKWREEGNMIIYYIRSVDVGLDALLLSLNLAVDESLAEFIHLDVGEFTVGGVDRDLDCLAIGLLLLDLLDVDAPFLAVHGENLAHFILEVA